MDRNDCIKALVAAGMTWEAATTLFHDQIAWRPDGERWFFVEHFAALAREDAQLRAEE